MKENTKIHTRISTTHNTVEDINKATKAGILMASTMAGLVGAWGLACLIGALMSSGVSGIVTGYISAITGM